jgi:hypothetical protein
VIVIAGFSVFFDYDYNYDNDNRFADNDMIPSPPMVESSGPP